MLLILVNFTSQAQAFSNSTFICFLNEFPFLSIWSKDLIQSLLNKKTDIKSENVHTEKSWNCYRDLYIDYRITIVMKEKQKMEEWRIQFSVLRVE